jgi:hypothetical protein
MATQTCDNCGEEFPGRMVIDGEVRVLHSRRYCLDCSPFKSGNTKQLHKEDTVKEGEDVECSSCGREYEYDRSKGHRQSKCNSCYTKSRRKNLKQKLVNKFGGSCGECDYNDCLSALVFHHTNPEEKEFGVTTCLTTRSWEKVVEEAKKCKLLCSNCHKKNHCSRC